MFFIEPAFHHLKVDTIEMENTEELQNLYKMIASIIQATVEQNVIRSFIKSLSKQSSLISHRF